MKTLFENVFIPDFDKNVFFKSNVLINNGVIAEITDSKPYAHEYYKGAGLYITPGFIDCHVHTESSHLTPSAFGDVVLKHGTLHVVTDNHEIANVGGMGAVEYFMDEAKHSFCNIKFAVPSCVPATPFATSGAQLGIDEISSLLEKEETVSLGEMMNNPGVIQGEEKFVVSIAKAKALGKVINGHAPGLSGEDLLKYVAAGVMDDHESESYHDIKTKLEAGLKIFLREGSAEHTDNKAYELINEYPDDIMFCTDDKSLNHILRGGHISYNVNKALKLGIPPVNVLKAASRNGLKYYGLDRYSEIKPGMYASFIIADISSKSFEIKDIYIDGKNLSHFSQKNSHTPIPEKLQNSMNIVNQSEIPQMNNEQACIRVKDGSLITEHLVDSSKTYDLENDILKLCVFERYGYGNRTSCKINGFNLKRGAFASSIAHDCHNIVAVGTSDESILKVVNSVIDNGGGLAVSDDNSLFTLPLEIGGLVTSKAPEAVVESLERINEQIAEMGCTLTDPLGTLSFMALEVIPHLKLTDKGLFDVDNFRFL
ncbi:Adenine deaminase [Flexistipes sinusarabici DSM 4947]|uniref:Adenine deaminase n=1 Tax=Flexistipes sinusarabici (strain ATCC 49648 / DSM 4947 / MAS 10) TaxID=717231 RepID=F8E901_FLESM|nr:adenine deaminase [Flexistipes sinusarabici]AEI14125.1 Adenine deaminase [Flexistipes sinusarabici DSM 4947]